MPKAATHLMVGFNRRFSPLVQTMKRLLGVKGAQVVYNDHERGRHTGRPLDPGSGCRRRSDHRRGVPLHRPDAVPGRGRRSYRYRPAHGRPDAEAVTEDKASIMLGFAEALRHHPLPGQRERPFPRNGSRCSRPGVPSARQFLKLTATTGRGSESESVAAGQGAEGLRRRIRESRRRRRRRSNSGRRVVRGRQVTIDVAKNLRAQA